MRKKIALLATTLLLSSFSAITANAQGEDPFSTVSISFKEDLSPLKFVSATPFLFNEVDHNIELANYEAAGPVTVKVLDNNVLGMGEGWELLGQLTGFNDGTTLPGATITLGGGSADSTTLFDKPTANGGILNSVGNVVASAKRNEVTPEVGYGTWDLKWNAKDIYLTVPEGASTPGIHTAKVLWTMQIVSNE